MLCFVHGTAAAPEVEIEDQFFETDNAFPTNQGIITIIIEMHFSNVMLFVICTVGTVAEIQADHGHFFEVDSAAPANQGT